jgi:putative phosphoribosyl transferase
MEFASREDAGQRLGNHLRDSSVNADIIAGLPRGGVVVAAEVARMLRRPLDVLVVRKIGHPRQREFAVGALAENDVVVLDRVTDSASINHAELYAVIAEENERLREGLSKFQNSTRPILANQTVVLVDDGLATGATAEAAVASARKQGARKIIVAVPVASPAAFNRLRSKADETIALVVDPGFQAVGRYYDEFPQASDEEVLALLQASRQFPVG